MVKELNPTQEVATKLTPNQAVNVLIQGARIAQSKGAFTLEDAALVAKAIEVFSNKSEVEGKDPIVNEDAVEAKQ